jgi:NAD-dependent dihydropyrimidine dehydrogenase PreA subunit
VAVRRVRHRFTPGADVDAVPEVTQSEPAAGWSEASAISRGLRAGVRPAQRQRRQLAELQLVVARKLSEVEEPPAHRCRLHRGGAGAASARKCSARTASAAAGRAWTTSCDSSQRPGWYAHLCPVGAFYALIGSRGVLRVHAVRAEACTHCGDCFERCPQPQVIAPVLRPAATGRGIADRDCLRCGRCLDVCGEQVFALKIGPHPRTGADGLRAARPQDPGVPGASGLKR